MLLLVASTVWPLWSWAESVGAEYQIKAAFLYKFGSYVQWPAAAFQSADAPLVIAVLGPAEVLRAVERLAQNRQVDSHPVVVRPLHPGDPPSGVHILFVATRDAAVAGETLAQARGQPVLIVTEEPDVAPVDSMINFVVVDDRVRFDVALQPAERSQLRISARLLNVARRVHGRPA